MKPPKIDWKHAVLESYANMMMLKRRLTAHVARQNEFDPSYKAVVRLFVDGGDGQARWAIVKDKEEGMEWCQKTMDRLFKEEYELIFGEILKAIHDLFDNRPGKLFVQLGISQGIARPSSDGSAIVLIVPEIPEDVVEELRWGKKTIRLIWRQLASTDLE